MSPETASNRTRKSHPPALIPKLRFPEFQGDGGWEEKTIGEVCKSYSGGTPTSSNKKYYGGKIPFIRSAEISKNRTALFLTQEGLNNSAAKMVSCGDVLFALYGANSGDVAISNIDGAINQAILCLRSKNSNAFVYFYLTLNKYWILKTFLQGGQGNLSGDIIKSIRLGFPNPKEQQKIADCLGSLDDLIAAHNAKLGALQDHKKGLLQKLFPAEGQTIPELRFPGFEGEWELIKLGGIIKERAVLANSDVPLFSLTIEDGVTPKTKRYERAFLVANEKDAYKLVYSNDFAYNPMNLRFGAIAKYSGTCKVALSKYYNIFYCSDTVSSNFCHSYFRSKAMVAFYDKVAEGSLIEKRRVHFNDFLNFKIRFPIVAEQNKIADLLKDIEALITAQTDQISALKEHKKGLMQQLFPNQDVA